MQSTSKTNDLITWQNLQLKDFIGKADEQVLMEQIIFNKENIGISQHKHSQLELANKKQELILNYFLKVIKNYLLFCSASDCSILITFQKIDK